MTHWQLEKHPSFGGVRGPVLVVVMDGVGYGAQNESDAVWLARKPTLDRLHATCPHTRLNAHGLAVGMPSNADMGNSEVGHNALGAGRIYDQGAKLVQHAIDSGLLYERDEWRALTQRARERSTPIHFVGLLSDGNVHSHINHLLAMVARCNQEQVRDVRVHVLLDGRDVPETSGLIYVDQLEQQLAAINARGDRNYRIASGGGRMVITMDRYQADWSMVERGYGTHVRGEGRTFKSAREAIETYRGEQPGLSDQNLPPFVIVGDDQRPVGRIEDGSSVVLFNFRGDRAIEFTLALENEHFEKFDRKGPRPDVCFAGMMQYDGDLLLPSRFLVPPPQSSARSVSTSRATA